MSKQLRKKVKLTASSGQGSSEDRMPSLQAPGPGPDRSSSGGAASADLQAKKAKKKCTSFQMEWLSQFVETADKQAVKLGDVFSFSNKKGLICKTCREAEVPGDFSEGKVWKEWKVDYLKRHVKTKIHVNAVGILQRRSQGSVIGALQQERDELPHPDRPDNPQVKVLIENILLAIKMDSSLQNVQQIHDHMAKHVSLPDDWRSEKDAVEFVHNISEVVEHETMCNIRKAPWHTLIVSPHKRTDLLMMYIKYREENKVSYKTEFCGTVELTSNSGKGITEAINQFYARHGLDLQRMVMLTSDDSCLVLGDAYDEDSAATLLRRQIPHLTEQRCMVHGKDISGAWDSVPLTRQVDTLLKALAGVVKSGLEDMFVMNLEEVLGRLASRSVRDLEPKWLACYRAMLAVQKNGLEDYCSEQGHCGDPVAKYCGKKLSEYAVVLQALQDVLGEVVELDNRLKKDDMTTMDGHRLARATVEKLQSRYREDKMEEDELSESDNIEEKDNTDDEDVDLFTRRVTEILSSVNFSGDCLKEWSAFDITAVRSAVRSEYGTTGVAKLAEKYKAILRPQSMDAIKREYHDFKRMVKEKLKQGTISTFSDAVAATLGCEELREVSQLVDICGTFQASTAECNRGFELINEIKKASGVPYLPHLEQLLRIKSRQEAHGAIDVDKVYNYWRSGKHSQGT